MRRWIQIVGGPISSSAGRNLSSHEAETVFRQLLEGEGSDAQVASIFLAIRGRGVSTDELVGFARAARRRMSFPQMLPRTVVVATTRLGKLKYPPLGLAAAAAAATAGARVALQASPHVEGGGITLGDLWQSIRGSDCLFGDELQSAIQKSSLHCWCPSKSDPGWERLMRIEEEVGLRSIPDQVSKLLVPEGVPLLVPSLSGPVLGMASDAIATLGHRQAAILQGVEASIDPSCSQRTRGMWIADGFKSPLRMEPGDYGLQWHQEPMPRHSCPIEAAKEATARALMGIAPEANTALLGAALMLTLAGVTRDFADGASLARDAIESGKAYRQVFDVP
ncbi:MAG: hypothetical protein HQ519_15455 [Planctomycetes bacterium]|nr:hypothetical protein [Planctomycetota bacterium]